MATFSELYALRINTPLREKITTAIAVKADEIRAELTSVPNHVNRLKWAKEAITAPERMAETMHWGILAANRGATSAAIQSATDAQVLTAVGDLVDVFATG